MLALARRPAVAGPLFVLGALIACSRVYVGVHYPLDVLGGAALGLAVATALRLLAAGRRRSAPSDASRLIQIPIPRPSAGKNRRGSRSAGSGRRSSRASRARSRRGSPAPSAGSSIPSSRSTTSTTSASADEEDELAEHARVPADDRDRRAVVRPRVPAGERRERRARAPASQVTPLAERPEPGRAASGGGSRSRSRCEPGVARADRARERHSTGGSHRYRSERPLDLVPDDDARGRRSAMTSARSTSQNRRCARFVRGAARPRTAGGLDAPIRASTRRVERRASLRFWLRPASRAGRHAACA